MPLAGGNQKLPAMRERRGTNIGLPSMPGEYALLGAMRAWGLPIKLCLAILLLLWSGRLPMQQDRNNNDFIGGGGCVRLVASPQTSCVRQVMKSGNSMRTVKA